MAISTKDIPAIDDHFHIFDRSHERPFFEQHFTLSMLPVPKEDIRNTLTYRILHKEMQRYFNMPGASIDKIIAERERQCTEDPMYIDKLYQDANLKAVLADIGFPNKEFCGYEIDYDERQTLIPHTVLRKIVRIEPIIFQLLNDGISRTYPEFRKALKQELRNSVQREKAVAIKTVIAYRTGLCIHKESDEIIAQAYQRYSTDIKDQASNKIFRDDMIYATLEICTEMDLPMQIHTGMGDAPALDVRKANPTDLYDIIAAFPTAKIIIVHAGYPYVAETGIMVNEYPNVYVDLSEMIPFAGIAAERTLLTLLEMCPVNKIIYGSDNNSVPETAWFSAIYFRRYLEKVLNRLIDDGVIDDAYAMEMAEMIMYRNAERIYKL